MESHWAAYVGLPLATIVVNAGLSAWLYVHHRGSRGVRWFIGTLALGGVWMAFHILMLVADDAGVTWLAFVGAEKFYVLSILTWIVFASQYSRSEFHRRWPVRVGFALVLGPVLLPTFVEPFRGAFYQARTHVTGELSYWAIEPGVAYTITGIVLVLLVLYAVFALVQYLLSTPRQSGFQLVLLLFGSFSVSTALLLGEVFTLPAARMNHGPYGALPFSLLTALALFRFRLFDVVPVARNTIVEELRDPVVVLEGDGRLVDYNEASSRVWPDIGDDVGAQLADACPELAEKVDLLPFEGPPTDGGVTNRITLDADGRERHYSVTVSETDRGDGDAWYAVLLRDITELEESRRKLALQNDRLDQVASTISHDLRNPISVGDGYLEMLRDLIDEEEGIAPADAPTALEYLGKASDSNARMEDIIDDVLAIAREGKTVEETDRVHLEAVARDAWENVDADGATLTITGDTQFQADRSKLLSILENLFRNAVDHIAEAPRIEVGPTPDGFAVADDGPGIPREDVDDIFEYGYSTADGGTGLGLSIVRTMAESHGWSVAHDDEYTDGTRFVFSVTGDEPTSGDDHTQVPAS